jgi:carbon monoxide dehydrogenase subunit G
MQLEQSFTLPFPLAAAWPAFADVPMLVSCLPGAALQGEPHGVEGGADVDLTFTVKLGPITVAFQGRGEVRCNDAAYSGTFTGAGADRKSGSRVKGEAKFALTAMGAAETRVDISVNYSLSGALAQFSRGAIVQELAAALTRDFAANLRARIARSQTTGDPTSENAPAVPVTAPAGTQPLDAGRLIWRAVGAHLRGPGKKTD